MRLSFAQLGVPLAVLVLVVFGQVCTHEFVRFDDPQTIANNPDFDPPTIRAILGYWTRSAEKLYVPLTYNAWGALAFLAHVDRADEMGSRLNPWIYHSANVAIHLASSLLVLAILLRLTLPPFAALLGAALFAVHPVQVEAAAWASGTKDLLCGAFGFATVYCALRTRGPSGGRWLVLGTIALLLALLSKPTGVVMPLMTIAIDVIALRTPWRRSLATFWPWLVLVVPFVVIGRVVQPPVTVNVPPLWVRPLVAADALAFYLWKLIWPFNLALDYGRAPARAMQHGWLYLTWIAPATMAIVIFLLRRRLPLVATGALVAIIGVLPVLGFVPFTFQSISTVADHYLYPAMLGISLILGAIFARWDNTWLRAAGVAIVLALGVRAFDQAGTWQNDQTLFEHALAVNPRSALSRTNLAMHLFAHDDRAGALDQLEQAVQGDPDYAFARFNLARLLALEGRVDDAAEQYRQLMRIYATQRNYDPKLAADTQAAIDVLLSRGRGASATTTTTRSSNTP